MTKLEPLFKLCRNLLHLSEKISKSFRSCVLFGLDVDIYESEVTNLLIDENA